MIVRISKYKQIFTEGYLPNWTDKVFTTHNIILTISSTYILKDDKGNVLEMGFYVQEINKTK